MADEFITAASAGFTVARNCEPGPGQITARDDTGSAITLASGLLRFTGAGASDYTAAGITFTPQARAAGKVLLCKVTPAGTGGFFRFGWNQFTPGFYTGSTLYLASGAAVGDIQLASGGIAIGSYAASANEFANVLRATGHVDMQKVGGRWKVLYVHNADTTASMPPSFHRHSNAFDVDYVRVLTQRWQTPVLASDSFNRANGALGSTDGAGCEEPGGSGVAWSVLQGTCAISSNAAAFSARDGTSGVGLAVVDTGLADVVLECTLTTGAAAGIRPGIAFRVTDASNYWRAYLDNNANTLRIDEVASGSVTNKASVAATVADSTAYRMLVICDGASVLAIHNNATAATATAATGLSATKHGLWCDTGIAGTYDNFSAKPRNADGFEELVA